MQGSANLNLMIKAARSRALAGEGFPRGREPSGVGQGAGDFVSRADVAAEKIIKDDLMGATDLRLGW